MSVAKPCHASIVAALAVAGLLGTAAPAGATSGYYHLAQKGLCNHTDQSMKFDVTLDCREEDHCAACRLENRQNFHTSDGGTLGPQECASTSFYLETNFTDCEAEVTVEVKIPGGNSDGECIFDLDVVADGARQPLTLQSCDAGLVADHGDDHFQVTIKQPPE